MAVQKVATQVIEDAAVTDAKLNTTGTMPAWNGSALTNLPESGDKRNFIIDGDFTQWPEGDKSGVSSGKYGPALWRYSQSTAGTVSMTQSTTVPTFAQSGHQSEFSCLFEVDTADASVATSDLSSMRYIVTGSDYAHIAGREVTLNWWTRSTTTGTYCVSFRNSASDRSYVAEYSISVADTWEEKTVTLTLDDPTSGTWLYTEADKGLVLAFIYMAGTNRNGATADTWEAANNEATTNQTNLMAANTNNIYISQVSLTLGSTAPTFSSPSIATVKDQVEYYYQSSYTNGTAPGTVTGSGAIQWLAWAGSGQNGHMNFTRFSRTMRATPSITMYSPGTGATGKGRNDSTGTDFDSAIGGSIENQKGFRYDINTTLVAGHQVRQHFTADARH